MCTLNLWMTAFHYMAITLVACWKATRLQTVTVRLATVCKSFQLVGNCHFAANASLLLLYLFRFMRLCLDSQCKCFTFLCNVYFCACRRWFLSQWTHSAADWYQTDSVLFPFFNPRPVSWLQVFTDLQSSQGNKFTARVLSTIFLSLTVVLV